MLASSLTRDSQVFAQSKPVAFDQRWLASRARALAAKPYVKRSRELPQVLLERDWDEFHFRPENALWSKLDSRFAVQFFHRSKLFRERIDVFEVVNGRATPVTYDPAMFDYGRSGLRTDTLPRDLGFAGLRLTWNHDPRDFTSFLGASYFRAVGDNYQWGLSARGLAVNSGVPGRAEEFPTFTCFWLERPAPGAGTLIIHALLESESITGAYRFAITPGKTQVMDIDATLYPRKPIERLGIAPGTSMFQCGENDKRMNYDVRPEVHDSDGLAMWTGKGEWIWRPLTNPAAVERNAFVDQNPKGFGLLQRDRDFESYQDDQILYHPRPDLWVEPRSDWGRGTVQLLEIPTVDETFDNIVSFFCPEQPPKPGQELRYAYRLHWGLHPPVVPQLARTSATRLGLGGPVGKRKHYACRFVVDFAASTPPPSAAIEPVVQVSRGTVELASARVLKTGAAADPTRYRAVFDVVPPDDSTHEIELRMFLRSGGQPLTETWLYHWTPPAASDRKLHNPE
ncbi:MAG TPA: glucan biosynthesis protein D [Polyangiales bacterium]|nr:glucan biosynthesis protein D [Polyangiales bacterium]